MSDNKGCKKIVSMRNILTENRQWCKVITGKKASFTQENTGKCYFFNGIFCMRNKLRQDADRRREASITDKKQKNTFLCEIFSGEQRTGRENRSFFLWFFSWVLHRKICRYYQQTQPFFIYYFVSNMLTNFRQKWYIHCGGIMASS